MVGRRCSQCAGQCTQMKPLYRFIGSGKVHVPIPIWRTAVVTCEIARVNSYTYGIWYGLHDLAVASRIEMPHIVSADDVDAPLFTRSNHDVWEWTGRKGWHQSGHRRTKVPVISSQGLFIESLRITPRASGHSSHQHGARELHFQQKSRLRRS